MVIICSQLPGMHGTSVMNAFEILYSLMREQIEKDRKEKKKKIITKKFDDYSNFILETKSIIKATLVFIMKEAKKIINDEEESIFNALKKSQDPIWIENWPKGTPWNYGKDEYSMVIPYGSEGPTWQPIDLEQFSNYIGYPIDKLKKSDSIFKPFYTDEIKYKIKHNL